MHVSCKKHNQYDASVWHFRVRSVLWSCLSIFQEVIFGTWFAHLQNVCTTIKPATGIFIRGGNLGGTKSDGVRNFREF